MEREMNETNTRDEKLAAAQTRMAELAKKFLVRSADDLVSMREGLDKVARGQVEAIDDLRHLAHRMAGTGATLGFETIAARAGDIETLAEAGASGSESAADTRARFASALDALEVELRRARETQAT